MIILVVTEGFNRSLINGTLTEIVAASAVMAFVPSSIEDSTGTTLAAKFN